MSGIPVIPEFEPDPSKYAETGGEYVPPAETTYFVLTKNDVPLNGPGDTKYETWDYANQAANALNNGLDDVDQNAWGVREFTAPATPA